MPSAKDTHPTLWFFTWVGFPVIFAVGAVWPWVRGAMNLSCPHKARTGESCPFCGGTRSISSFLEGDVLGSLQTNPMVLPLGILLLVGWVACGYKFRKLNKESG